MRKPGCPGQRELGTPRAATREGAGSALTSPLRTHTLSAAAGPAEPSSRSEPPAWAGAPHALFPPAAAEAAPGPTGQIHPAAPGPNGAPRTRTPPPRRWPGPHLPLRHSSAQPGPVLLSSPGAARRGPSGLFGSSRFTDRRRPATPRPLSPQSQSPPRLVAWPRPQPRYDQSPCGPCRGPAPRRGPSQPGSQKWAWLSAKQAPPRESPGAVALRMRVWLPGAGSGAAAGPLTFVRHVECGSGRSWALGSFGQGARAVLRPPRSPLGGTSVPQ